jgi:hypothetical protein
MTKSLASKDDTEAPEQEAGFAAAWFDICSEYLHNREAFLQRLKETVGIPVVVASVGAGVDPASGHDEKIDEFAQHGAAAEARTDTKMARMEGKLDLVLSKLDGVRDDYRNTRATQWVIGLGLAVLIIAVVALLPVFFSVGAQIRDDVLSSQG